MTPKRSQLRKRAAQPPVLDDGPVRKRLKNVVKIEVG